MCTLADPADRRECACGTKDAKQCDKNSDKALVGRDSGPSVPGREDGAAELLRWDDVFVVAAVGMEEGCRASDQDHAGKGEEGGKEVCGGERLVEGGNETAGKGCHNGRKERDHGGVGEVEVR